MIVRGVVALLAALAAIAASDASDGGWLLTYAGKPASAALNDRRMLPVIRRRVPVTVVGRVVTNLAASSAAVAVVDGRFVVMSGCEIRGCRTEALLWIDAKGTGAIGAAYESTDGRGVLTIASNGFTPSDLPDEARASVVAWLSAGTHDPEVVEFVGPSNLPRSIDPSAFRQATRGQ